MTGDTVRLAPCPAHFRVHAMEGASPADRDILRRAGFGIIRTPRQYDKLLGIVSGWGFDLESPADWQFNTISEAARMWKYSSESNSY
jgi:hypothetical protein